MTLRGAIFDLDGTLLDSMSVWTDIDRAFLGKRGIPFTPDYPEALRGLDIRSSAVYTIERYGLNEQPEDLIAIWQRMAEEAYANTVMLKPGAKDFLQNLRKNGVKLAVATALTPPLFEACLHRHGIDTWFSAFAHCDEIPCPKSSPEVYRLAATRMGLLPEECAVFEDILPGLRAAKGAGFRTVAVYDASADADWPMMQKEADAAIVFEENRIPKNPFE